MSVIAGNPDIRQTAPDGQDDLVDECDWAASG
jgi:hypothetical protein